MSNSIKSNTPVVSSLSGGVLTVTLNRPQQHNALNPALITGLTAVFTDLPQRDDVRVVVLTGNGRSFCAGADLSYMLEAADFNDEQNVADSQVLFDLMRTLDECPKPVIGRINGAAIGGGMGLVSCCDIVLAVARAQFGFSEVRLGLVPAVISPFVLARIGATQAREWFLSGARFDAHTAQRIGLVNDVLADAAALDRGVAERVQQLLQGAPGAQAAAKRLIRTVSPHPTDDVRDFTARLIAERRASQEGREGMQAFLEKRPPAWQAAQDA